MTGKRPSKPIVLRAGIAALEAQAIAASLEQSKNISSTPGKQVTRMLWWLAAAPQIGGRLMARNINEDASAEDLDRAFQLGPH